MLAIQSGNMYHGSGHSSMPRAHEHFQPPPSYPKPTTSHQHHPPPPNRIQLPRLSGPQPYVQTSPSLPSGQPQRQDSTMSSALLFPDSRPQGPSLPGFKDIFAPANTQAPAPSRYEAHWTPRPGPPNLDMSQDARDPRNDQRAALNHRHTPSLSLHALPSSERRMDARPVDPVPVSRSSAQSGPTSPYSAYPDSRDPMDARSDRMRRDSSNTYKHNGAPSPYASGPADDQQYMSPGGTYDRSSVTSYNPAAVPESQRMYLGIKEIPGEGHFHLYDGGYRIPTQIDGEQVNPAWGLTKANKPRKRLALACLDCREKKIKCEPGANSCVQCEKAKRPCRRAPPQFSNSDTPPAATWSSSTGSPPRTDISSGHGAHEVELESIRKRRAGDEPCSPATTVKKNRSTSPPYSAKIHSSGFGHSMHNSSTATKSSSVDDAQTTQTSAEDPFDQDPETTLYLLDLYLMHVNNATVCMFPRHAFWHWAKTDRQKSRREIMVLHAVLAVGSIFADERYHAIGQRYGKMATNALTNEQKVPDLFGVQTRLLLALFNSTQECDIPAWEYTGAALRAATSNDLRLNMEEEDAEEHRCQKDPAALRHATDHANSHFSFSRQQYQECRRRTFWACFLRDRFSAGTLCAINLQDIHLRLPNTDDMYERSLRSEAPYYNNGIVEPLEARIAPTSPVCPMGWLVQVAAIWGDVLNFTNRSVHRGTSIYRDSYDAFYAETYNRMQDWASRLPEYLQYGQSNLERSIRGDYADTFITMHAVYHFTFMKLNRYVRHSVVRDLLPRNIRAALSDAQQLLSMMTALRLANCECISPLSGQRCDFFPTTAFIGNITLSAIDIAGSGGLDTSIGSTLEAINGGLACLVVLARYWNPARVQHRESQKRYYQIQNMVHQPYKARSGCWLGREWGMMDPLEKEFDAKDDCIYGATEESGKPNEIFFNAVKSVQDDATYRGGARV